MGIASLLPGVMPVAEVGEATTADALERLHPEWAALWARCPDATPFQSPEWVLAWWQRFGGSDQWVITLRRAGRLAAVLPLFVWRTPAGVRKALVIGTGLSDYTDALIEPGADGAARQLLARVAAERRWEACEFHQLRDSSPLLSAPAPGCRDEITAGDPCPVLALPDRVEKLNSCVPARMLSKLRYSRRRAAASGPVRVERADERTLDELFDALLRLHAARWSAEGQPGVLADESVRRFHREAARGLLRAGALRLYGLRIGDRAAAALYGVHAHGRAYYYIGGFDPALGLLSPGTLVVGHAIEEAVREGCREFDFLRGGEEYKYRWGAEDRPTRRRCLRPRAGGRS
jgi:CelD/BcsL family acetyltransferase involved in cellulose biosynthesis